MVWHVDNKTAPLVKPRKQPVFSQEVRHFTDEIGQTPTVPQADWFNMVQGELLQLAKALGVTPDKLNDGQIGPALAGKLQTINNLIPKVLDSLGDDRNNPASQRVVNDVNRDVVTAQKTANNAHALAQTKQDKLTFTGTGNVARMSEVDKKRDKTDIQFQHAYACYFNRVYFSDENSDIGARLLIDSERTIQIQSLTSKTGGYDYGLVFPKRGGTLALISDILGYGQKWVDVTSQRVAGTTYTNNTGKPIFVSVELTDPGIGFAASILVDNVIVQTIDFSEGFGSQARKSFSVSCIVPVNSAYKIDDYGVRTNLKKWVELR